MTFDQAVELARLIRQAPGWYVLDIQLKSGEKLEADLWAVCAISDLNWSYLHYFTGPDPIGQWQSFRRGWESYDHQASHELGGEART